MRFWEQLGLGSARVNHDTEFRISGFNQNISRITLQKHLIFSRTQEIVPDTE